jgi:hypothetical protein
LLLKNSSYEYFLLLKGILKNTYHGQSSNNLFGYYHRMRHSFRLFFGNRNGLFHLQQNQDENPCGKGQQNCGKGAQAIR